MNLIRESLPSSVHPQTPQLYGSLAAKNGKML